MRFSLKFVVFMVAGPNDGAADNFEIEVGIQGWYRPFIY